MGEIEPCPSVAVLDVRGAGAGEVSTEYSVGTGSGDSASAATDDNVFVYWPHSWSGPECSFECDPLLTFGACSSVHCCGVVVLIGPTDLGSD